MKRGLQLPWDFLVGEVRSGKNAIIKVARREERRRVRAPDRQRGRRMGQARGKRCVKDAIAVDCR